MKEVKKVTITCRVWEFRLKMLTCHKLECKLRMMPGQLHLMDQIHGLDGSDELDFNGALDDDAPVGCGLRPPGGGPCMTTVCAAN